MGNLLLFVSLVAVCGAVSKKHIFSNFVAEDDLEEGVVENQRHGARMLGQVQEDSSCICGTKGPERIYGGSIASRYEYPWMAMICSDSVCSICTFKCGGSLINDQFVLTAAHCVWAFSEHQLFVTLGKHAIFRWQEPGSVSYEVSKIILSKGFRNGSYTNDIALLKLDRKVEMTEAIRPICMPECNTLYIGHQATLTGWGSDGTYPRSEYLKETELTLITRDVCLKPYLDIYQNFSLGEVICTLSHDSVSCSGDSGGPLIMADKSGLYRQIGIVSGGWKGCNDPKYPGVYTKVEDYLAFIWRNTREATYCKGSWIN